MKTTHACFSLVLVLATATARAQQPVPAPAPAVAPAGAAQSAIEGQELTLNGFRAPSIGLEYRDGIISIHVGAYPTVINDSGARGLDGTTWFGKAGLCLWFLPVPLMGDERSSFYAGAAYLNDFAKVGFGHSAQIEAGFRWVIYQGLFLRAGVSLLYSPARDCPTGACSPLKLRPNPGIGLAIPLT